MHVIEQRLALFLPHGKPLFGTQSIDLPLDFKKRVKPFDRFERNR